jgi:hypothetical protein
MGDLWNLIMILVLRPSLIPIHFLKKIVLKKDRNFWGKYQSCSIFGIP